MLWQAQRVVIGFPTVAVGLLDLSGGGHPARGQDGSEF
jgi:hypothetical protein